MKTLRILTALFLMLTISTITNAQQVRSAAQHRRIANGVRNGELTRHERRQLARQQRHIRKDKRAVNADGVVTGRERRHLKRETRRASRNIYRKNHNRRDRN